MSMASRTPDVKSMGQGTHLVVAGSEFKGDGILGMQIWLLTCSEAIFGWAIIGGLAGS